VDTLFGLHPSQLDTITYTYTPANPPGGGITTPSLSRSIGGDSMVVITGLCAGSYTSFLVKTAGVCSFALPGTFIVDQPRIAANFDTTLHYGCAGDTVFFTNLSYPNPADMNDSVLTYKWVFGDGSTSTVVNPEHLYNPTNNTSFTAKLYITNSVCVDSDKATINLNNYVVPSFTLTPSPYVCQGTPVTFTNTSTGTNLTYLWEYGDGTTDITSNPSHIYTTTGKYTVKLVASDHIYYTPFFTPCYDTAYNTISVDSISVASILTQDTVICKGQAIEFNGIYSHLGDTLVAWTFGDGNGTDNVNPILHSFDGTGTFTVKLDIKYRACPETITSRSILAFAVPNIYLGPDTAMCPGSNAIVLADNQNVATPGATWKWSTAETTPSIVVTKPGTYYTVVTIDGCTASDTVLVQKDCYVDIPNVFTPNGDGVNDYFFPRQMLTRGVVQFKMDVYNRWGQNVYETESTDGRGWDGSLNNKPQPEGVYVYIIDVTFKDGQIEHHQGNITLLR
jgi:gliding motility-associated-like protein